jgi:hypothetical protein
MRLQYKKTFEDQTNPWGKQGGVEPQRSDLWLLWLDDPGIGIKAQLGSYTRYAALRKIPTYQVASIGLPELRVRAEAIRRDSRSYQMPSWDDPLDPIKISFILPADEAEKQNLMLFLEGWRVLVRAGRGNVSTEISVTLNDDYRIDYAYDIFLHLQRGGETTPPRAEFDRTGVFGTPSAGGAPVDDEERVTSHTVSMPATKNDFGTDPSYIIFLKNAWLSAYKICDLAYADAKVAAIEATFYAEDVLLSDPNSSPPEITPPVLTVR